MEQDREQIIQLDYLSNLRGKSVLIYLSSCVFKEEYLHLPYDYIVLNSFLFRKREQRENIQLVEGKVLLMPFDNEKTIRLMIDAGLKINCFVGIQDGCVDGGNHECINSQTFFSRLSPLIKDECLYITNHLFNYRKPKGNRIHLDFLALARESIPFDPACLSREPSDMARWKYFTVQRPVLESVFFKVGKIDIHVHHTSIWDYKEKMDGWVIPGYPPLTMDNYVPAFNNRQYLIHRDAMQGMLIWANQNKHHTIASVAFDTDENMVKKLLPQLTYWTEEYPKCIHLYHLKKNELTLFKARETGDHIRQLLNMESDNERYKYLEKYLKTGKGDPYIIPYLMLQFGLKGLNPLIKGLTCSVKEMRINCIDCLVQLGDIRAVNPLIQMFDDPKNETLLPLIREGVAVLSSYQSGDELFLDYAPLKKAVLGIQTQATENLSNIQATYTESLTVLIKQLESPYPTERLESVGKLCEIANQRATSALSHVLYNDNPQVQLASIKALQKIGGKKAIEAFEFFFAQKTCFNRTEMAEAMGELKDPTLIPILAKVYNSAWLELKVVIIIAIGKIGGPAVINPLIKALLDNHPKVRFIAVGQLKILQIDEALNALKQTVNIENDLRVKKEMESAIQNYYIL
jgi:HEAT repeat protein